jgi:hypothetical protein
MPGVANTLWKLEDAGIAGTIRKLEAATEMPGFTGTLRKLEAATASALPRNADPRSSSPDLAVPVPPIDAAVALQTDTAESHGIHQSAQSSRPPLPLAIHEYLVEIEGRAKRLLEGCHTPGGGIGSFDEVRATEILRSYAVDALDKQAEYYESQKAFSPRWLSEVVDRTVAATLDLSDPINRVYRALLQSQTTARLNPVDGIPESWPLRNEAEWWRRMLQVRIEQRLNRAPNPAEAGPADQTAIQICPNEARAATSDLPNPRTKAPLETVSAQLSPASGTNDVVEMKTLPVPTQPIHASVGGASWHADLELGAKVHELLEDYLPRIAQIAPAERNRLLVELVGKLYEVHASGRIKLVRPGHIEDCIDFDNEHVIRAGMSVGHPLSGMQFDDGERQAIERAVAGCRSRWLKEAIRKANSGESLTSEASGATLSAATPTKPSEWEEIEISFTGDHDVEIRVAGAEAQKLSYKQIEGFEDRRTGKPSQLWVMLRVFGSFPDGTMPEMANTSKEWVAIQKKIERTSKVLRKHFRLTGDPITYIHGTGYHARIKIRLAPDSSR